MSKVFENLCVSRFLRVSCRIVPSGRVGSRRICAAKRAESADGSSGYSASSMASSRAERTISMATSSTAVAEAVGVSTDR